MRCLGDPESRCVIPNSFAPCSPVDPAVGEAEDQLDELGSMVEQMLAAGVATMRTAQRHH
jgi:hypothetical protein